MNTQTLTIGKRRFVVVPERDFLRLQKKAADSEVRPEFAQEAMGELRNYRKTRKAAHWTDVKRKLGL
jgi:hypothetical protein